MLQVLVESPIIHCHIQYSVYPNKREISFIRRQKIRTEIIIRYDLYKQCNYKCALYDDAIAYIFVYLGVSVNPATLFAREKLNCIEVSMEFGVRMKKKKNDSPSYSLLPTTKFVSLEFSQLYFRSETYASRDLNYKYCRIFLVFHIKVINYLLSILLAYARWSKSNNRILPPLF